MSIAGSLKSQDLEEINTQSFMDGLKTAMEGGELKYDPQQANDIIQKFMAEAGEKKHGANKEAGDKFLAENAKKDGILTTPSGLQYEVVTEGNGAKPLSEDQVTVHYHGTLIDGTVFDSSVERNSPATFGVNQVIKGWTEALQLMNEGSKYRLYIPQDLAYGASPHPEGPIKPYMTLIFDVELLKVN
jgi:FKBP-type peptidyl-prolyl cis-trans isomerase FklB